MPDSARVFRAIFVLADARYALCAGSAPLLSCSSATERPSRWLRPTAAPARFRRGFSTCAIYPAVKVRVGAVEMKAVASEVTDAERDRLWDQMVDEHPMFSLYEQRAPVAITVVGLNPQSGESTERSA